MTSTRILRSIFEWTIGVAVSRKLNAHSGDDDKEQEMLALSKTILIATKGKFATLIWCDIGLEQKKNPAKNPQHGRNFNTLCDE